MVEECASVFQSQGIWIGEVGDDEGVEFRGNVGKGWRWGRV